jgi:hypothetical protein
MNLLPDKGVAPFFKIPLDKNGLMGNIYLPFDSGKDVLKEWVIFQRLL